MVDINKFIRHGDTDNPQKLAREHDLPQLDWSRISQRAAENNVILKEAHREVIRFLRDYYLHNGWPQSAAELTRDMEQAFSEHGGKAYLYQLFPQGPVAQAVTIAQLPAPAGVEQPSQGTVH
ncbi:MAG TPA: TusE/DsrC/DsvC family sulfur relay protein [Gammaproteobacteria bacterium]